MDNTIPLDQLNMLIDTVMQQLASSAGGIPAGQLSSHQITKLLDDLPRIKESDLIEFGEKDSSCPVCINPYLTILTEEEMAHAMDSPAHPLEELGVTKLNQPWQCGHIFCRRDISKWILEGHDSCPMCRKRLVEPNQAPDPEQPTDRSSTTYPEAQPRTDRSNEELPNINDFRRHVIENEQAALEELLRGLRGAQSARARPQEEDDRHQFSGMYS